jgi:hypothetical protein
VFETGQVYSSIIRAQNLYKQWFVPLFENLQRRDGLHMYYSELEPIKLRCEGDDAKTNMSTGSEANFKRTI